MFYLCQVYYGKNNDNNTDSNKQMKKEKIF